LFGLTAGARAQTTAPVKSSSMETVIVTAPRLNFTLTPNSISHAFVRSYTMPSLLTEKISRWEKGICPVFYGAAQQYVNVMEQRLRAIAKQAGAPLKDKGCKPNVMVLFTSRPDAQLDVVRAKYPGVLGYRPATTVTHPIEAWYQTGTTDANKHTQLDQDVSGSVGYGNGGENGGDASDIAGNGNDPGSRTTITDFPGAVVEGSRISNGMTSDLLSVTIIVDSVKTAHLKVGTVADYVAMLTLSRTDTFDSCQIVPSIANLLAPDCDDKLKPDQIAASDIAYLRGVYRMDPAAKLIIQQDEIASEMAKALPP
jgi:hypothetical protein